MNDQVWHSGPPPSVGWWPATVNGDPRVLRWWNGACWSAPAMSDYCALDAAKMASVPASRHARSICWTQRPASWPDRSRT